MKTLDGVRDTVARERVVDACGPTLLFERREN
jgi:hypothetical protein